MIRIKNFKTLKKEYTNSSEVSVAYTEIEINCNEPEGYKTFKVCRAIEVLNKLLQLL